VACYTVSVAAEAAVEFGELLQPEPPPFPAMLLYACCGLLCVASRCDGWHLIMPFAPSRDVWHQ
jgi:hypothetical protein